MPPKKKAGKKDKKAKITVPSEDIETRHFFETKIQHLNRILAKLRSSAAELFKKNEKLISEETGLVEDSADVVIFLERCLKEADDNLKELQNQEVKLQKEGDDQDAVNFDVAHEKEEEIKQLVDQLNSEIKLLTGKLSSLEEFRLQRDDMMKKFEEQENDLEEQLVRHKRVIYIKEKEYIVSKDLLKKEMEAALIKLCNDFQDVTDFRVAATTHELLKKNITTSNKLSMMMQEEKKFDLESQELRRKDKFLRMQESSKKYSKEIAIKQVQKQITEITALTLQCGKYKDNLEELQAIVVENEKCVKELEELKATISNLEIKARILEQNIHNLRCKRVNTIPDLKAINEELNWLKDKLVIMCERVKVQLSVCEEEYGEEQQEENVLCNLLADLTAIAIQKSKPTFEAAISCSGIYMEGPEGLIPRKIVAKVEDFATYPVETQTSLTSASTEEVASPTKVEEEQVSFMSETVEDEIDENKEEEEQVYFSGELSESEEEENCNYLLIES